MILDIKYATTQKTKSGNLLTYGVAQRQGRDGNAEIPGGGGRDFALFHLDHRRVERETWNKQQKNFEKLQRQTARLIKKYGFRYADNENLELKYRTNKY